MSVKHFVLQVNPQARYSWERCRLSHPLTGEVCDPSEAIAAEIGNQPGTYLLAVRLDVTVLDGQAVEPVAAPPVPVAPASLSTLPQLPARLAS